MRHYPRQDLSSENDMAMCYEAASKYGLTQDKADTCEDGNRECPDCPWKGFEEEEKR